MKLDERRYAGILFRALLFVAILLCQAPSAFAQAPEIGGLLPAGGPRGGVTSVRIDGKNLAGAKLFVSGPGLTIKSVAVNGAGDQLTAEFVASATARLGPHEIRIVTPKGASNGSRFWVDIFQNRVLPAPMTEAQPPLELERRDPIVINSRIAAQAGRDRFFLNALANETWVFDLFADRIRSRFDPVVEIRDSAGGLLKVAQSTWEHDPRFAYTFAKAGRYSIIVRDAEFLGGTNFTYRMLVGRMPFISGFLPRGERPGRNIGLDVEGKNLGERTIAGVTIPADAPIGEVWTEVRAKAGVPAPIPLLVEETPVASLTETDATMPLPIPPVAMDGAFMRYTKTRFFFKASAKDKLLFDLLGRRIGSRIDGALRILDKDGKEVASNDDTIGKDARLYFAPPAEGIYTVEARNVEEKTGPDCFYRLEVKNVLPDYSLEIKTDRLNIPAGGTIAIPVAADRMGGFDGAIKVGASGLATGVRCSGGVIAAGKTNVEITLTALAGAAIEPAQVRIVGEAEINGKSVVHIAPPWEQYEHRSVDLTLSVEYSYTRPHHIWDLMMLAVTDQPEPAALETSSGPLTISAGSRAEINVKAIRSKGADGEIKLEVRGLPHKVTASASSIPAKQTDGKIILSAAADVSIDSTNLIIQGKLGNTTVLAPAVAITVTK